ncbi:TPA: hypothetical protein IVP22_002944 [Enterococcus faecium]|nr:hypothetical protein [Enterococcus faecium]HAP7527198.1 hypothetical protein [Enterococcus faecium]HAQ4026333.1 hypothetical protein [Enterococcus faecium]
MHPAPFRRKAQRLTACGPQGERKALYPGAAQRGQDRTGQAATGAGKIKGIGGRVNAEV